MAHKTIGPSLIIGGGLASLMTALFLRIHGDTGDIWIVERANDVGGLLRAQDEGAWGKFDHGMHTFTSTMIPEIDELVFGMLPSQDWIWLRDEKRDLSGVAFAGKLQTDCHYVDLRLLDEGLRRRCVADFFDNLDRSYPSEEPTDMRTYSERRFGEAIADEVISPIVEKLYGRPAGEIDPVVARLLPLDRIAMYSEETFKRLIDSPLLRERIAYPDQRNLPLQFSSGRYSTYPKAFGAYRLVDAIVDRLLKENVRICTSRDVQHIEVGGNRVLGVVLLDLVSGSKIQVVAPKAVYWTAGLHSLGRNLQLPSAANSFEAPKSAAIVNLLLDRPPEMKDLYYFWGFDIRTQCFRVTNFSSYSPGAPRKGGYPLAIEFFLHEGQLSDPASLLALAKDEMRLYGVMTEETRVLHHVVHAVGVGFPILSRKNRAIVNALRGDIDDLGLDNLVATGIQSEWGVVFQPDVLTHAWTTVRERLG